MQKLIILFIVLGCINILSHNLYSQNKFQDGLLHEVNVGQTSDSKGKKIDYDTRYNIYWQRKTDMPEARRNLKIAAVDNKIFALGGYAQPHKGVETGNFCYDIKSDSWSIKLDMLTGRSNFAIAAVNGKIYTIGGDKFLDKCEVYNPKTNIWIPMAPMPTARQHINCGIIDNKIYVPGGRINWSKKPEEALTNTHEVYDINSGSWNSITPFPQNIENPSIAAVNGKLYVISGYDQSLTIYDPVKNIWEERNNIPSFNFITGSAVIDDKIFVLDGVRPEEDFSQLFVYNTADDSWSKATSLPVGVKLAGFISVKNTLYIIGGCDQKFIATNHIFKGEIDE